MKKSMEKTMNIMTLIVTFLLMASPGYATLIAFYDADGNTNDLVGGNNGTLNNGAGFAAGQIGQAFDFDGLDDSLSISDIGALNFSPEITIAAWVRPESVGAADGTTAILWKGGFIGNAAGQSYSLTL